MPLTPNGKLDRSSLPAPDLAALADGDLDDAPHAGLETALAAIWQDLLHLERVGRHADFFALGGHSLLAMRLVSRVRDATGLELSLRDIFGEPTLARMAATLAQAGAVALPPLLPVARDGALALSLAQQRLWLISQVDDAASSAYHLASALHLRGPLQADALCAALGRIVARHESLRTTFPERDGQPVQAIAAPAGAFALRHHDLRAIPVAGRDAALARIGEAEASQAFDLAHGPLIRGQLLCLADEEHVLLVTQHHLITDGWSVGIMVRELSALYDAFSKGRADPLPPLLFQYADYAAWQRQWCDGAVQQGQANYWRQQLQGAPALLEVPTDRPRPARQSYAGGSVQFQLPLALSAAVRQLARQHDATLYMTLLAAWACLLARVGGQDDVVIGTPVANRRRGEFEGLIGFFVNTLAIRIRLDADPSVAELLAQVKTTMVNAYVHQDLPFEQVVEALNPPRSLSYNPVIQTSFTLHDAPLTAALALDGLTLTPLAVEQTTSHFDLSLAMTDDGELLSCSLDYASDLFERTTAERLGGHFLQLLSAMAADAGTPVSRLALLSDEARRYLLEDLNPGAAEYPREQLLHHMFEARAAAQPQACAIVADGCALSYGELDRRANQLAHYLIAEGVAAGDRIGICVERDALMIVALLAVLKAGAAYVPLDPVYPQERLAFMQADAGVGLLLTQERLAGRWTAAACRLICLDHPAALAAHQPIGAPGVRIDAGQPAYITYTSGSTGKPKGIAALHRAAVNYLGFIVRQYGVGPADRVLQVPTLSFDASVRDIFGTLSGGATLVLLRSEGAGDPYVVQRQLVRDAITAILSITPSFLEAVAAMADADGAPARSDLRLILVSGEVLGQRQVAAVQHAFGAQVRIYNQYGPTECTMTSTFAAATADQPVRIGKPVANARVYVLDRHCQPVPLGVVGELYIGGAGVAQGYLNQPALSAERFIADPFSAQPQARMYRTGDLGRWCADGQLDYLGRNDFQVKIRGFRVELGEIEVCLAACAGVREALVVARTDGDAQARLVAYVLAHPGAAPTAAQMRAAVAAVLPGYMVPSAFVTLSAFPLNANGKLDRSSLPAPDQAALASSAYEAPQDAAEQTICAVWQDLLGIERVGRHDNFFDLGGHSLLVTQVVSRLRMAWGKQVPMRTLFEAPTLAGFAAAIALSTAAPPAAPPIVVAARGQALPLSFAQQRLWFANRLDGDSVFYNMFAAVDLAGALDVAALHRSLEEIVRRHDILRTSFADIDGVPLQLIASSVALPLPLVTLAQGDDAAQLMDDERNHPFDLGSAPLMRATLLRLDPSAHRLLLTMHHAVSDGWSMGILVRELSTLYRAYSRDQASPLPELAIQYADFAAWQRHYMDGAVLQRQLAFWCGQLAGAPQLLAVPTDRARPAVQRSCGEVELILLPRPLADVVAATAREFQATPFMVLLSVLEIVLHRWTGQQDMVLGTVVAGRTQQSVEPLIGCFMNFLPLRLGCQAGDTLASVLARVTRTVLDAYAHQDCPFEKIIEAHNPPRDASHNPGFNVAFLLQNFPRSLPLSDDLSVTLVDTQRQSSALDLRFVAEQGEHGIGLACEYNTDLFDRATVALLLAALRDGVAQLLAQPQADIADWTFCPTLQAQQRSHAARERRVQVVIAATFTAEPILEPLQFWLAQAALAADIAFAPYNQALQVLLDPHGLFAANADGVNLLLVRPQDWLRYGDGGLDGASLAQRLRGNADEFLAAVRSARQRDSVPLFAALCPPSLASLPDPAVRQAVSGCSAWLEAELAGIAGLTLLPAAQLQQLYPVADYEDQVSDELGHVPYTMPMYAAIATLFMRKWDARRRRPYKVIALDCDFTLWQGVCAEAGPEGVAVPAPYRALQQFMVAQHDAGMLVCLVSKNAEHDVDAVFARNTGMLLQPAHIVASRINWLPKSDNLRALAQQLDLGLDSFIFVDDNPVECAEVRANCPEVLVLELPQASAAIPHFLDHVWAFDHAHITDDARQRTEQYRRNGAREQVRQDSADFTDFLEQLQLRVDVQPVAAQQQERVAELTRRTNQFNLRAPARTGSDALALCPSCFAVEVSDRFGAYGLTGALQYHIEGALLVVDTFLLSCRVLGRGVERHVLAWLLERAEAAGARDLQLTCEPTGRNQPMLHFLESVCSEPATGYDGGRRFHVNADSLARAASQAPLVRPAPAAAGTTGGAQPAFYDRIARTLTQVPHIMGAIGAAGGRVRAVAQAYVAPGTDQERRMAAIWCELLQLDRVGLHDHFFELGGHSLLATRLVSRIRAAFAVELPLRTLFAAPVLQQLVAQLVLMPGAAEAAGATISPAPRETAPPLSFAQQRWWFLDQLNPSAGAAYHIPVRLRLRGTLHKAALQAALARIVARHEILRTAFVQQDGATVQSIAPPGAAFVLGEQDFTRMPAGEREAAWQRWSDDEMQQRFDLAAGAPVRAQLFVLAPDEHILIITQHHIISDGWSIGIMVRELTALYTAFSQGLPDPLATLAIQFADYALWQRQWLQGESLSAQLDYWKAQLAGAPACLELPLDASRPAVQSHSGARITFSLGAPLTARLRALGQAHGTTLFMTLHAGWCALLARLSGQDDVVIGTPVANRGRAELDGVIGPFVNTLALRTRLGDDPDVAALLARIKALTLDAYAHQDVPFEQVVEAVQPPRHMSHSPIFQVLMALNNTPGAGVLALPGLVLETLEQTRDSTQFDLELWLVEAADSIDARLEYASDLFDPGTIERIAAMWQSVLAAMAADATVAVSQLPLLTPALRRGLLVDFNDTVREHGPEQLIHHLFERQARERPDALALVYGAQRLNYGALNRRANQIAHYLIALGVAPDDRVALCVERGIDMVVALLGILKAGAAYVPLDPAYPPARLKYMLDDSAPVALLTQSSLLLGLAAAGIPLCALDDEAAFQGQADSDPEPGRRGLGGDKLAYVIYTSGSTGQPKGVMVEHRCVVNLLRAMQGAVMLQPGDGWLAVTTLSFDIAALELFLPLLSGARLVLASRQVAMDGVRLASALAEHDICVMQATPASWRLLLQSGWRGTPGFRILCGGEAMPADLALALRACAGAVWNLYGPTETTIWSTACRLDDGTASASIGRPLDNTQVYVLDRHAQLVAPGVIGEIHIAGAGVARGYLNRPELTAERFLSDPFNPDPRARMYRTGDLGRWRADGSLDYLGRNDFQVKLRGFRIELGEIEACLASCAGVRQAVVVAAADGGGAQRLLAYLVVAEQAPSAVDLRAALLTMLPDYMVPSAFVHLVAFPLTPNGKIDRQALPAPDQAALASRDYLAPQGGMEQAVARIWQEMLGVERVGRHDHFFELGGHSLLGLQVIGRIREQLDLDIPVQLLFENPELAPFVASATRSQLEQLADGEFGDMERELASLSEEELLAMLSEGVEND